MENPLIQRITKKILHHFLLLRKDKTYRHTSNTALIIGKKLVEELLPHVKSLLVTRADLLPFRCSTIPTYLTTEDELKRITGIENPEPIAAEISFPKNHDLTSARKILVLDRLQDPGNLGALLRSALAFGFDGAFFIEPSVDLFNDKVIRSSKGSAFFIPYKTGTKEEALEWLQQHNIALYIADLEGSPPGFTPTDKKMALILGNEGQGVDPFFKGKGDLVKIPISAKTESLNVAIAGSILMYLLREPHV